MRKIIFCQFSNKLLSDSNTDTIADRHYNGVYQTYERDGYYKDNNFFELPLWIAEICGSLNNEYSTELYIIEDISRAIKYLKASDMDYICFSVLDINKHLIKEIVNHNLDTNICLGGYIDFSYFDNCNVRIFKTVKDFISRYLDLTYKYNLDYSLFKGNKTIPRLTLSYGCLNRCKFCTVEKTVIPVLEENVLKQVMAFRDLNFKLVYLNDKTLGQVNNYTMLPLLFDIIKEYNSDFQGFIIQTTCIMILDKNFQDFLRSTKVIFAIELGVETYNDNLLYGLDKPQTTKTIIDALKILKQYKIKIILNLIIGIIGETYQSYTNTLYFIETFQRDIYLLNIYNLSIYQDTELSKEIETLDVNDSNENIIGKGFYNKQQKTDNEYFYNEIFQIGLRILNHE
jgi:hypothetical protein